MKRLLAVIAAASAVAVLASGCSDGARPVAVKVGDWTYTQADLQRDLEAQRSNKAYVNAIAQQTGASLGAEGTFDSRLTAAWLTQEVEIEVAKQLAKERRLTVTDADRTATEQRLAQGQGAVWTAFPKSFRTRLVNSIAPLAVLQRSVTSQAAPSDAEIQAYFDANKERLCPGGRTVAHILVKTLAEAQAVEARLAAGEDFAAVAKEVSTDGSAAQGGALGCAKGQSFVTEFQDATDALAVGQISAPVQTQYGYHVITVRAYTLDVAKPDIEQALAQQASQRFSRLLNTALRRADVWVNPVYGRWGRAPQQGWSVIPPTPPAPQNRPATTTTVRSTGQ